MTHKIKIYRSGALICETEGFAGETLHACISAAGLLVAAPCGGNGRCGKCLVRLSSSSVPVLACRTPVEGDMEVYLPDETEMIITDTGIANPLAATHESPLVPHRSATVQNPLHWLFQRLGVAVDIGTTTVVAHLIDIESGTRLTTASGVNAQIPYGADVISRIQYCIKNGHETLTRLIREQLALLIDQMCTASGTDISRVEYIAIAANTVMEHLLAGYAPDGMGTVPFTPVSLFGKTFPVWEDLPVARGAKIYYAPAISSYVGGDITAGMLAAGLEDVPGPAVYLDIGTNGEIALKYNNTYYCCATAAGPAFEGAEISMGMAAISGAIDHIKWDDGLRLSVIGNDKPKGLCGSGLLDALAVLLETGAVDETGRLLDSEEIENDISSHISKAKGENVFWLTKGDNEVYMLASDIRKLQLAKAAIAAGIQTLLGHADLTETQIETFILAGGFGSFMDKHSAARIGLFPESFLPVTKSVGNTAGEGAVIALCLKGALKTLEYLRERCEYIELSTNHLFNEQFVEQMTFEA